MKLHAALVLVIAVAACGDDGVTGPPVATVAVAPSLDLPMVTGATVALTAELRDDTGAVLSGRRVTWSSSDPAVVMVGADGVATAVGAGGPVEVTATSEGAHGSVMLRAVDGVVTGIADIRGFLDTCPTDDPAYAQLRRDFELRVDGAPVTAPIACTAPYSTLPIAQLTDELYVLQALRVAYYMSEGTAGYLPWTPLPFYDWLHARVSGINLKSAPGQLYCCDQLDGKLFFAMSRQEDFSRDFKRAWPGLSTSVAFFAHEIRHADPGAPPHVNGCPAFPNPGDPLGCDATYDLANLGSYGIQYWLDAQWATGAIHLGLRCSGESMGYATFSATDAGSFRDRFVSNAPPAVSARMTYGGDCP